MVIDNIKSKFTYRLYSDCMLTYVLRTNQIYIAEIGDLMQAVDKDKIFNSLIHMQTVYVVDSIARDSIVCIESLDGRVDMDTLEAILGSAEYWFTEKDLIEHEMYKQYALFHVQFCNYDGVIRPLSMVSDGIQHRVRQNESGLTWFVADELKENNKVIINNTMFLKAMLRDIHFMDLTDNDAVIKLAASPIFYAQLSEHVGIAVNKYKHVVAAFYYFMKQKTDQYDVTNCGLKDFLAGNHSTWCIQIAKRKGTE